MHSRNFTSRNWSSEEHECKSLLVGVANVVGVVGVVVVVAAAAAAAVAASAVVVPVLKDWSSNESSLCCGFRFLRCLNGLSKTMSQIARVEVATTTVKVPEVTYIYIYI